MGFWSWIKSLFILAFLFIAAIILIYSGIFLFSLAQARNNNVLITIGGYILIILGLLVGLYALYTRVKGAGRVIREGGH
jgi:succinate-acetate transporter protein